MKEQSVRVSVLLFIAFILSSCANIVPPEGGKKDIAPPKLVSITPSDSLLNTRVTEIEMHFDEFLVLKDASKEVQVSPVLPFPLDVKLAGKKVKVLIPDSLLKDNTTYRVDFGTAIRDLHEENAYKISAFIFSTGSYFDSLMLSGKVINANTGTPAEGVKVMVYLASDGDSAVVKKKPLYITKSTAGGNFSLPGLPEAKMHIYALKDENDNMIFDGDKEEIAFANSTVTPMDSVVKPIVLYLFKEKPIDTLEDTDGQPTPTTTSSDKWGRGRKNKVKNTVSINYRVAVDTSDTERRTHDVNEPVLITAGVIIGDYNNGKVSLSYDSLGTDVLALSSIKIDSTDSTRLQVYTNWKENTVYTLRLLKGFIKDTASTDAMPSKYKFRTKGEDDYAKLQINIPGKYKGAKYLLQISVDKDTLYKQPVIDTVVKLEKLNPASYKIHLIVDENENGEWDTGNLLERLQPEIVIPHSAAITLKAGWENVEEFTPVLPITPKQSPPMSDTTNHK